MDKEITKKFVENNGFICNKCGKVIVDGHKHKNEEDLCDQCKIADLEAKLEESEKKYAELFCRNTELETLYSQKTALVNFYKDTDLAKENNQLKQQLVEKEKEVEEHKAKTTVFAPKISNNADLILQIIESDRVGIDYLKQKQNQTAIEVLEDLKGNYYAYDGIEFLGYIDQQIKLLKGEK